MDKIKEVEEVLKFAPEEVRMFWRTCYEIDREIIGDNMAIELLKNNIEEISRVR